MHRMLRLGCGIAAFLTAAPSLAADPAPFELTGPSLRISVTRGEQSLPIAQVPSLSEGDKIMIAADLPADQGVRFILVSAFMRGATNPPPKDWIDFAETWRKKDKDRTLTLTVPKGARQMALFLVPDTGGAEGTLSDAVRGKPGEFVKATQYLNQASLDRSRLEAFMAAIRAQENSHPEYLRRVAPTLARSLSVKLNEDCLSKVIEMQATCLLENRESLAMADVHTSSMAETLTGAPTSLALQLSATREGGGGFYSPYIAVVRDIANIFGAFANPEFDYLPALGIHKGPATTLLLNAAPSFQKPKSVLVVALPTIEADNPPRLRGGTGGPVCAATPGAVLLPVEGAPLIYSTAYARAMQLSLKSASGETVELPLEARADLGGYVLAGGGLPAAFQGTQRGHLHGHWGFDRFDGPDFLLQMPDDKGWTLEGEPPALVVGRSNDLLLKGSAPACVESVILRQGDAPPEAVEWKVHGQDQLMVSLPLADRKPGPLSVEVKYRGVAQPSAISLRSRAQASRLDELTLHAGDKAAMLSGQRLDQVETVAVEGLSLKPDGLTRDGSVDRLKLVAEGDAVAPEQGRAVTARVKLRDGRTLTISGTVSPPRPQIALLSKSVSPGVPPTGAMALGLSGDTLLPDNGRLVFSVRAGPGTTLAASDVIEIAPADEAAAIRLTVANGLRLESPQVMVATLEPKAMAPSLFGPLRFRLIREAEASDWQPLVTLARLPQIEGVECKGQDKACTIRGRDLFLIEAIGVTAKLDRAVQVANGYTGSVLKAPAPVGGRLYIGLRDAPDGIVTLRTTGAGS
ncbi:MAG: hypothetical protein ABW184_00795 [Sphingobium sp.]